MSKHRLTTLDEIKEFIKEDKTVYYFVSASNFNLMMMSDWVDNWFNVNFIDSYNQKNSSVILPEYDGNPVFRTLRILIISC